MKSLHPFVLLAVALAVPGCEKKDRAEPSPTPVAQAATRPAAAEVHGVHNVIPVTPRIVSGSAPESAAGFEELKQAGIKTIISVDGTPPNLELASKFGMRYVHLPVGYHGLDRRRQLELARAVRDLPGPVYVHCHHGRHRGPAAAASAAVILGELTADEAVAFLKKAGTSENYSGLYGCVRKLVAEEKDEIDAIPPDFPEVAPTPGFVKAMAATQAALDHLQEIRDADWTTPADHPDLVAENEAQQLESLLAGLQDDPYKDDKPEDFAEMMRKSWEVARDFNAALRAGDQRDQLAPKLKLVNNSCKQCHVLYRDTK